MILLRQVMSANSVEAKTITEFGSATIDLAFY